jgi:hypothetical protein
MVTLLAALETLVDQWKQHVGPGEPMAHLLRKIDSTLGDEMMDMTSDSPTRRIVSAIESTLSARSHAAVDAAEFFAEGYRSKKNLVAETTLETFLTEIWPKAPRQNRLTRSASTRGTAGSPYRLLKSARVLTEKAVQRSTPFT